MPFCRMFYHITWGTKDREPIIEARFENSLHNVIAAKAKALGGFVYAVGGYDEHVHLATAIPASISVAAFVGQLKGNSSHWVNHGFSLGHQFAWQEEYGVLTFGGNSLPWVVAYVKDQREHHQNQTAIRFLERTAPEQDDRA